MRGVTPITLPLGSGANGGSRAAASRGPKKTKMGAGSARGCPPERLLRVSSPRGQPGALQRLGAKGFRNPSEGPRLRGAGGAAPALRRPGGLRAGPARRPRPSLLLLFLFRIAVFFFFERCDLYIFFYFLRIRPFDFFIIIIFIFLFFLYIFGKHALPAPAPKPQEEPAHPAALPKLRCGPGAPFHGLGRPLGSRHRSLAAGPELPPGLEGAERLRGCRCRPPGGAAPTVSGRRGLSESHRRPGRPRGRPQPGWLGWAVWGHLEGI